MLGIGRAFRFLQLHTALLLGAVLAFVLHCVGRGGGGVGEAGPEVSWAPTSAAEVLNVSDFDALPNGHVVTRSTGRFFADTCAQQTCPYGAWLCDELVGAGRALLDWETDAALYPAASLWGGLPEGQVTTGHLKGLHGASDNFTQVRLTGAAIEQTLLSMLDQHFKPGSKDGCFLQTGGLRYKAWWNALERAWDLDVVQVRHNGTWRLLEPQAQYNLITDRRLVAANACNYSHLYQAPGALEGSQTRVLLFRALAHGAASAGTGAAGGGATISPPVGPMDRACLGTVHCSWSKTIGVAAHGFHSDEYTCRSRTCSYGIFLAEALLQHGRAAGRWLQIALFNGGSIQSSLEAGEVSWEDVEEVHPYGEVFVYAELPATVIRKVLEKMLNSKGLSSTSGDFLQMAGIRFYAEWDRTLRSWDLGTTEVNLDGHWVSVDMRSSTKFRVVMNRFIMRGGDGFSFLTRFPYEVGGSARSVAIRQFLVQGTVQPPEVDDRHCFSNNCSWLPVLATTEGRLDGDPSSCQSDTCSLGILACEGLLQTGHEMGKTVHAVLLRASVFRGSIPPGNVTYSSLAKVFASGEAFVQTWMTGHEIHGILLNMMVQHGPPSEGKSPSFLQLAGLRMRADWDVAVGQWKLPGVEVRNGSSWHAMKLERKYGVILEERLCTDEVPEEQEFLRNRWKETLGLLHTQLGLYFQKLGSIKVPLDDDRHCFTPHSCRYPSEGYAEALMQAPAESGWLRTFVDSGAVPALIAVSAVALAALALATLGAIRGGGSQRQADASSGATLLEKDRGQPTAVGINAFVDEDGLAPGSGFAGAPLVDGKDVPGVNGFSQQTTYDGA